MAQALNIRITNGVMREIGEQEQAEVDAIVGERVCGMSQRFPGDDRDAVCALLIKAHRNGTHMDKTLTRAWYFDEDGDPHVSIRPGSTRLEA